MTIEQPPLKTYNTLSGPREPLSPLEPGHIGMYVCGPTVYSDAHLQIYWMEHFKC